MKLPLQPENATINDVLPTHEIAIYIHIPFCKTRCTYCAFNTYTGQLHLAEPYAQAITQELAWIAPQPQLPVNSIYFGGGTPSLMPATTLHTILDACARHFALMPDCEITLETNPGTVSPDYLAQVRALGVNRISIGMQSAHPSELRLFARGHTTDDVYTTLRHARQAGFISISLDLIYGIPRQSRAMWENTVETAIQMLPDHISLYSLSIEDATPLQRQIAQGHLKYPDADRAADMYDLATEHLAAAGYVQYEISNWAKPGYECRHNLHVWRNRPYLGFGAGAHGYAAHTRYANMRLPAAYITQINAQQAPLPFPLTAASEDVVHLDQNDVIAETMMLGLRLVQEGVGYADFERRFGCTLASRYGAEIDRLIAVGLLERTPDERLRITTRGRLLGNRVFAEFI